MEVAERAEVEIIEEEQPYYSALRTVINMEKFRILLLRLFVYCQLSLNLIEQSEFRELLLYIQPTIERYLPARGAINLWITDEFSKGKEMVKQLISTANSRIHISFDMWTSPAGKPILGICAHFLNLEYSLVHPLLALRYLEGNHTSQAMAGVIEAVMQEFGIVDKWGVCVADNADNNDTCVAALVRSLRPGEETTARRSRCFAHMVNLAAKAFIYGQKHEGFLTEAEQVRTLSNRDQTAVEAEMKLWRQRGSFGKFHNFVKYVRSSPLRRQKLEAIIAMLSTQVVVHENGQDGAVAGPIQDHGVDEILKPISPHLTLKLDNATRWNSAFLSIQRGLRLRQAIRLYLADDSELQNEDVLDEEDWAQLEGIYHGLKPFWETTMRLEGHGHSGSHGVIWEVLPGLSFLLFHLEAKVTELTAEQAREERRQPPAGRGRGRGGATQPATHRQRTNFLLVAYNNAWDLLKKYNALTDDNHEIYAAATLLNPCVRRQYFDRTWIGEAAAAHIEPMLQKNRGIWEDLYSQDLPAIASEPDNVQQHGNDDFERYINGQVTPWVEWKGQNLYHWWSSCEFSQLRQWALDTLSIPAMSAELERVFSQAKHFYTDDRNRLLPASFERMECLLQWHRQGVHTMEYRPARNNHWPANQEAAARVDS